MVGDFERFVLDGEYLFEVVFQRVAAWLMLGNAFGMVFLQRALSLHRVPRIYPRRKLVKVILAVSFFLLGCRTGCEALTGLTLSMIFF